MKDIHLCIEYLLRLYMSGSGDTEMKKTYVNLSSQSLQSSGGDGKVDHFGSSLEGLRYQPGKSQNPLIPAELAWCSGVRIMTCKCASRFSINPLCVRQQWTLLTHTSLSQPL